MTAGPIPDIVLDHVAVAVEAQAQAWPRYAGDLPAAWIGGGGTPGFWSAQVRYANGMKVEVLEPYLPEQNDFLRRFLDHRGPGPHHLTFKVGDIRGALDHAAGAGYRPVGVNLENPHWMEAFLHPKDAPGVVVQLAQSADGGDWGDDPTPSWFPTPRVPEPATLVHVAHAVADPHEGRRLFVDLLGGAEAAHGEEPGLQWTDLAWPGPGRIRLLAGPAVAPWLEGRAGRVHHLAFATRDPGEMAGARRRDEVHEVAPEDNLGVRLVLADTDGPFVAHGLGYVPEVP